VVSTTSARPPNPKTSIQVTSGSWSSTSLIQERIGASNQIRVDTKKAVVSTRSKAASSRVLRPRKGQI
jgi:hypothetical protein